MMSEFMFEKQDFGIDVSIAQTWTLHDFLKPCQNDAAEIDC